MSDERLDIEKASKAKMQELHKELVALPPIKDAAIVYTLNNKVSWNSSAEIQIQVFPKEHPAYYKTLAIYTETSYLGSWRTISRKLVSFVRIKSDKYDIYFKRNWTFDTPGLAKRLHKKIAEMSFKLIDMNLQDVVKADNEKTVLRLMKKKFTTSTASIYVKDTVATINLGPMEVVYRHDDQSYTANLMELSETQLDKVIELLVKGA